MVKELKDEPFNPVLIYKTQGLKELQYPMVPDYIFMQTEFQMEFYRQHAPTILCIDSTHGTNQYNFELITCVVPDAMVKVHMYNLLYQLLETGRPRPIVWCLFNHEHHQSKITINCCKCYDDR